MIYLVSRSQSITEGSQARNLETRPETAATEWHFFLPMSSSASFLCHPGPPVQGWPCLQWADSSPSGYESGKYPTDLPIGYLMEATPHTMFSLLSWHEFVSSWQKTDLYRHLRFHDLPTMNSASTTVDVQVSVTCWRGDLWGKCPVVVKLDHMLGLYLVLMNLSTDFHSD